MKYFFFYLVVALRIVAVDVLADGNGSKTDSILRAVALGNCACKEQMFNEDPTPFALKKGNWVGEACSIEGSSVLCEDGFAKTIICPKNCISLRTQGRLSKDEIKAAVMDTASGTRDSYQKKVPAVILSKIRSQYPNWLPVLYNPSGPFIAKFILMEKFYFEVPISIRGKSQMVSIVYFFQDFEHLLQSQMNWSFWTTSTGELVHNSIAPYLAYNDSYVHSPCLAPAGSQLDEVVLFGIAEGVSDASGCCGPYSLKKIENHGPIQIKPGSNDIFDSDVIYNLCSRSTNKTDGKYVPEGLYEINGPANIRKYHTIGSWTNDNQLIPPPRPEKSEIIGTCSDHSRVADLGSNGDWHHVYCEGKSGWTHKRNIRNPN